MKRYYKPQSGQALLFVMFFLVLISLGAGISATYFQSASKNTSSYLHQEETYYTNAGLANSVQAQLETYMTRNVVTLSQDNQATVLALLQAQANAAAAANLPPGFTILNAGGNPTLSVVTNPLIPNGINLNAQVPRGPYAGLGAVLTQMALNINLKENATGAVSNVNLQFDLGTVSPFEFLIFSNLGYIDLTPTNTITLNGRIQSNGDLCLGGNALNVQQVTVAGRLMNIGNPLCLYSAPNGAANISTSSVPPYQPLSLGSDYGCVNCSGSGLNWADYEYNTWNGNANDVALGVTQLNMLIPSGSQAQNGYNGNLYASTSNLATSRVIVDPVLFGGAFTVQDSGQDVQIKASNAADIRVIDGVWYIKPNPLGPGLNWPGIAIYSDHAGSAQDVWGNAIGQQDIAAYWAGQGLPWAGLPQKYSYYSYDSVNQTISNSFSTVATAAISYGSLGRIAFPAWSPAGFMDIGNGTILCGGATSCAPAINFFGPSTNVPTCGAGTQFLTCTAGQSPSNATWILNAARSGFLDTNYLGGYPGGDPAAANVLPVNLDVHALEAALATTTAGELGSYFGAANYAGHKFNGIIYVTTMWPHWNSGFTPVGLAAKAPDQGAVADALTPNQPNSLSTYGQQALPQPLCSSSGGAFPLAGQGFDTVGGTSWFKIPDCANYAGFVPPIKAFPTALRIINGTSLSIPLSIVTNMPAYVVGNYNNTSPTWKPSLIAGDVISVYSNKYVDKNALWGVNPSTETRVASTTTIDSVLMTGMMRAGAGSPANNLPILAEDWTGVNLNFNGSLYVGWYPVMYKSYISQPSASTWKPAIQNYSIDPNLLIPTNQPPGTNPVSINSVFKWMGQ